MKKLLIVTCIFTALNCFASQNLWQPRAFSCIKPRRLISEEAESALLAILCLNDKDTQNKMTAKVFEWDKLKENRTVSQDFFTWYAKEENIPKPVVHQSSNNDSNEQKKDQGSSDDK